MSLGNWCNFHVSFAVLLLGTEVCDFYHEMAHLFLIYILSVLNPQITSEDGMWGGFRRDHKQDNERGKGQKESPSQIGYHVSVLY